MVSEKQKVMGSRERILQRVKENQPQSNLDERQALSPISYTDVIEKFTSTLTAIGGQVLQINKPSDVNLYLNEVYPHSTQIVSSVLEINRNVFNISVDTEPHSLSKVEVAILKGEFGVAENGAIWITQDQMLDRALPFICENLILLIAKNSIVATLHDAYNIIGEAAYQYGTFIAGPSKTADIEQSLVLGAHGPKALTVFLLN